MIRHSLLTLALIGAAGVASAQTMNQPSPTPSGQPYGSPGAQQPMGQQPTGQQPMAQQPMGQQSMDTGQQAQMAPSSGRCGHQATMKDEYGFRYDTEGNRLNAQGCVIAAPQSTP